MRVEVVRSGGFGGFETSAALDTDQLSDAEADELRRLVEAADVPELARRSPLLARGADRFQYDVSVTDGAARHEVTATDVPPELRALVDHVLEHGEGA